MGLNKFTGNFSSNGGENFKMDNELYHYGVLGMKWGVRRSQKQLARINKKAKRQNWSEDAVNAAKVRTKSVKQMSNAELRKLNERTRLENEYSNLRKGKPSAGRKFVSEVGRELAKDYTKQGIKKGVKWVGKIIKEA